MSGMPGGCDPALVSARFFDRDRIGRLRQREKERGMGPWWSAAMTMKETRMDLDDREWQMDGHVLMLELDAGASFPRVWMQCPGDGPGGAGLCRETPEGECFLDPFVDDLGLELMIEPLTVAVPVAWRVPDEEPELAAVESLLPDDDEV